MYAGAVQDLIDELGRLPGIGPKSAQRIAFYLLKAPGDDARRLARAIDAVKDRVAWCRRCFNVAERLVVAGTDGSRLPDAGIGEAGTPGGPEEAPECDICRDPTRDGSALCVVEEPKDVLAVERSGSFRGRYHVLQGLISPIDGIGAEQLRVRELLARLEPEGVAELILCMSPTIEGDATVLYLSSLLRDLPVQVTRLASGLPVGGDLEYADEVTLARALEGRRTIGT